MRLTSTVFLLLAFPWATGSGQAIEGRLMDAQSSAPIILGRVTLLAGSGEIVDQTYADETGRFLLASPDSGNFFLRGEHLGYQTRVDGVFELGAGGLLTVEFRLVRAPIVLDTLSVSAERRNHTLDLLGFYDRQRLGSGHFLGPEEIARRPAIKTTDLLRMIPRVRIKEFGFELRTDVERGSRIPPNRTAVTIAGSSSVTGKACYPVVMIDGSVISRGGAEPASLDDLISPSDIAGIEVYRGASETPLALGGTFSPCGAILLWTW